MEILNYVIGHDIREAINKYNDLEISPDNIVSVGFKEDRCVIFYKERYNDGE